MATFSARTHAEAVVEAAQQDIWDALVDPDLMAAFTPFLKKITAQDDHWIWQLSGIEVGGLKVAPAFTEKMVFAEPDRIDFHHDPPSGTSEKAGVEGWYELSPVDGSDSSSRTKLVTELEITLDLPLPKVTGPAVRVAIRRVIDTMGDRFSANLLEHLGAREA